MTDYYRSKLSIIISGPESVDIVSIFEEFKWRTLVLSPLSPTIQEDLTTNLPTIVVYDMRIIYAEPAAIALETARHQATRSANVIVIGAPDDIRYKLMQEIKHANFVQALADLRDYVKTHS